MRVKTKVARTAVCGASAFGLVAAAALTVSTASAVDLPTVAIDSTVVYKCDVTAKSGGSTLNLGKHRVQVQLQSETPAGAYAGAELPETEVDITLTMPESLRANAVALGAKTASGGSPDSSVVIRIGGQNQSVPLNDVTAPSASIPQKVGQKWKIASSGTTDAAALPSQLPAGPVQLFAPDNFTVDATIVRTGGPDLVTTMDCTTSAGDKQKRLAVLPQVQNDTYRVPAAPDTLAYGCNSSVIQGFGVVIAAPYLPKYAEGGSTSAARQVGVIMALPANLSTALASNGFVSVQAANGTATVKQTGSQTADLALTPLQSLVTEITSGQPTVIQTGPNLPALTIPAVGQTDTLSLDSTMSATLVLRDSAGNPTVAQVTCQTATTAAQRVLTEVTGYSDTVAATTTLTASPLKTTYGSASTLTATLAPSDATGKVVAFVGNRKIAAGTVSGGSASINLTGTELPGGVNRVWLRYNGDPTHKTAATETIVRVTKGKSTLKANATPKKATVKKTKLNVTATVTAPADATSGRVIARVGDRVLGGGKVTDGKASFTLKPFVTVGTKTLTIVYKGNDFTQRAATTQTVTVTK